MRCEHVVDISDGPCGECESMTPKPSEGPTGTPRGDARRAASWAENIIEALDRNTYRGPKRIEYVAELLRQYRVIALKQAAQIARKHECSIARGTETCNCDLEIADEIESLAEGK